MAEIDPNAEQDQKRDEWGRDSCIPPEHVWREYLRRIFIARYIESDAAYHLGPTTHAMALAPAAAERFNAILPLMTDAEKTAAKADAKRLLERMTWPST